LKLLRGLIGPVIILGALFGIGYGAVTVEDSSPAHPTVMAVSMTLVRWQNSSFSDWSMALKDNSTITVILDTVCQRNYSTNDCDQIGPVYGSTTPYYFEAGETITFGLTGVNTTMPTWELHILFYGYFYSGAPSNDAISIAPAIHAPTTEWLSYNLISNSFIQ